MDRSELEITAELAHLELNDDELESLGAAVSRVVEYFSLMQAVDVSDLEPTTHVLLDKNRLRSDQPNDAVDREALLDNAPEVEDRFILVPNVL
ncbi:MAG: Asp-tRNA(Asn)/Glu-tRNA(Gln) amidotransferase subunit GatC [Spirochaetes bacterium]|jgi:aspartyl-tRNA(Asn)/glutamyl-tRNA(Gln) amidotransferase subunit C|nr:Asp-tRNA(Asn)/Glu-tRNA(Gln) amidotransferase subunit GatC [Spirochaetota bacterium]